MTNDDSGKVVRLVTCPQCGKRTRWEGNAWRPFCCERCKMVDLGAWATESYRISSEQPPGSEAEYER